MKRNKKIVIMFLAISLLLVFSACAGGDSAEYESVKSFEFHFYPEEYEEEYSEVSKILPLEADTEYQLKIDAACQTGTMEISISYEDENDKQSCVNADTPYNDTIIIPQNAADEVKVVISIEPDTKGSFICDLQAYN
mgnify:FL=1